MASLKVPVDVLISNAEKVRARLVREHERKVAAVTPALTKAQIRAQLVAGLRKLAKDIERGAVPTPKPSHNWVNRRDGYRNTASAHVTIETGGEEVDDDRELAEVLADLKLLRSTTQETVSVQSGSNLAKYL